GSKRLSKVDFRAVLAKRHSRSTAGPETKGLAGLINPQKRIAICDETVCVFLCYIQ
ncbi:hypothetical protein U1Q18_041296, partial [Sarracenia purpurea var. burkii]